MTHLTDILSTAAQPRIMKASLRIALVVGFILNVINQGGSLWGDVPFSISHFLLNFMVPFCVSSYSAARNELNLRRLSHALDQKAQETGS
jgi:hypothetical protein